MREAFLQVGGEAVRVAGGGQQRRNRVEHLFRRDRGQVGIAQAVEQRRRKVVRIGTAAPVVEREGVAAIAAAEGVIVGFLAVHPHGRAGAGAGRHGVEAVVFRAPGLIKVRPKATDEVAMCVQCSAVQRAIAAYFNARGRNDMCSRAAEAGTLAFVLSLLLREEGRPCPILIRGNEGADLAESLRIAERVGEIVALGFGSGLGER